MKRLLFPFACFLIHSSIALALPPDTAWLGGSGNFLDAAKWNNGRPGQMKIGDGFYNLTASPTGSWVNYENAIINSGTLTLTPQITTVYALSTIPEERYPTTTFLTDFSIPNLHLGETASGSLAITGNMSVYTGAAYVGIYEGSTGQLTLSGAPAGANTRNFSTGDYLTVGREGIGRVTISNGAVLSYSDHYRKYHVGDWFVRRTIIGSLPTGNGFVTVNGAASRFTFYDYGPSYNYGGVIIGREGIGGLTLENGGKSDTKAGRIGVLPTGDGYVTVTGANSIWDVAAQMYVGERGKGSMLVSNGGVVNSGFGSFSQGTVTDIDTPEEINHDLGSIGTYAGSQGSVVVNGTDSVWNNNANLVVGASGQGSLSIEGGRVVSTPRTTLPGPGYYENAWSTIGLNAGSVGTVTVKGTGGRWQNGSGLMIGAQGTGTLRIGSGGTVDVTGDPVVHIGENGSGTLIFGGDDAAGAGTLGGTSVQGGFGTSLVRFQHNQTFTPTHQFKDIGTIENSGPGTTILTGRLSNIGNLRATKGNIELNASAGTPTVKSITVNGGNLSLKGLNLTLASGTLLDGSVLNGNLMLSGGTKLTGALGISGANAIITVDGPGTRFTPRKPPLSNNFVIGDGGSGQLILKGGGTVPIDPATLVTTLGYSAGASGYVEITGLTSQVTAGSTTIGRAGTGLVRLQTFGNLQTENGLLGELAGSSGTADIQSSGSWQVAQNSFTLGKAGAGRLELSTGGSLRVGANGTGTITMGALSGGSGLIQIGKGGAPGSLYAASITGGATGYGIIQFYHDSPGYTFQVAMSDVLIKVLDGNKGTTALTSDVSCGAIDITTGGLKISGDGHVVVNGGYITIGDQSSEDPGGGYVAPFMIMDGNEVTVNTDGLAVGKVGEGEFRLKNSAILMVGRPGAYAEITLGGPTGRGTFIFGGNGDKPGDVLCAGIRAGTSDGKIIFDHPGADYTTPVPLLGPLTVEHRNTGNTLLTATPSYTGPTLITGGTLMFQNSNLGTTVTTSGTGAVGGMGTISRLNVQSGGSISPGTFQTATRIATQRVGIFNLSAGGRFRIDMGPAATCDFVENWAGPGIFLDTAFNPPTTGQVWFDFKYRGINQNGVYPVLSTGPVFTADFMSRLRFTSDFPLTGYFQQTRIGSSFTAHSQLEFVVTSFGSPAYDVWARDTYGLDLTGNGRPEMDADNDGTGNMLEFILGSSPVSGRASRLPKVARSGNNMVFTFRRRTDSGLLFTPTVQYSYKLDVWHDATPAMISSAPSAETGFDDFTATIPIPAETPEFFARLKADQVNP